MGDLLAFAISRPLWTDKRVRSSDAPRMATPAVREADELSDTSGTAAEQAGHGAACPGQPGPLHPVRPHSRLRATEAIEPACDEVDRIPPSRTLLRLARSRFF
ncbi:hypothetical protein GCM10010219_42990 [Streptomyces netropsis]|nr:hypothetical protein GCM10010219_42990 [Streptomyces netropsis]